MTVTAGRRTLDNSLRVGNTSSRRRTHAHSTSLRTRIRASGCGTDRRGDQWCAERWAGRRCVDRGRTSAVAQGDVDAHRTARRRAVERAEPVRGLSHDGDVRPRIGLADIPGARIFCRRRRCGESSATSGNKWRAHLAPDKTGRWTYRISFVSGKGVALTAAPAGQAVAPFDGRTGTFQIARDRQEGSRLSRARAVAVRGQALSAVRRQRRILSEARHRFA